MTYAFRVGSFDCAVICDGTAPIGDYAGRFPTIAPATIEAELNRDGLTRQSVVNSYNILFIQTDTERILVDTGFGQVPDPDLGRLVEELRGLGVMPADISLIILTHLHGDHIGGLTENSGALMFPNARYAVSRDEWQHWMIETTWSENSTALRAKLEGLEPKLKLMDWGSEIVAGISLAPAVGHTPGQSAVLIQSAGDKLVHLADAAHAQFQMRHPDWSPRFDLWPERAAETRREWFVRAAQEGWMVLFYHFAMPGLGWIEEAEGAFRWKAIEE